MSSVRKVRMAVNVNIPAKGAGNILSAIFCLNAYLPPKRLPHSARTDSRKYFIFSILFHGNEIKIRPIASDDGKKPTTCH